MATSSLQDLQAGSAAAGRLGKATLTLYNANLPALEIFAVLASAALITATVFFIVKTGWFSLRVDRVRDVILKTDMPKKRAQAAWAATQKHFFAGDANDLKIAVMEADNILNDALQYAGIRGVNLGDRLKTIKRGQMPNLEDVWAAHKLRNEIAHETNFSLKRDTVERALDAYEVALKNLGVFTDTTTTPS
jgi:hypothetical protein